MQKTDFEKKREALSVNPKKWLVTGAAGFIGSSLVSELLRLNQQVVGVDNFSTGKRENLSAIREIVGEEKFKNFSFLEGDITNSELCRNASEGVDIVSNQAAFVSVPGSFKDPSKTYETNVLGLSRVLVAAKEAGVKRVIYASSSAVYGDCQEELHLARGIHEPNA